MPDTAQQADRLRVVFVASSSFSGSTTLGLVLGTDPRALFVGEPNQIVRPAFQDPLTGKDRRVCTCGESPDDCPFWSDVRNHYRSDVNLNPAPGLSLANLRLALEILSPLALRSPSREVTGQASLLEAVAAAARKHKPGIELLVDASKSIRSLDRLARAPNIDLVVVHLIRDCVAVADSFKHRGSSSLYGAMAWALVNSFLSLYVRRRGIPVLRVGYEAFCQDAEAQLARLNGFLGTSLTADRVAAAVRREPYHLFSGNGGVRQQVREFTGIAYRPDRGHLGRLERWAVRGVGRLANGLLAR